MSQVSPTVSEARLLSVLDTAVDGIVVIDDRSRILVFNKACEQLFGHPAEAVVGKSIKILMPPEFSVEHDGYVANYMRTGVQKIIGIGREVRGCHADGTVFPIELSVGEPSTTLPVKAIEGTSGVDGVSAHWLVMSLRMPAFLAFASASPAMTPPLVLASTLNQSCCTTLAALRAWSSGDFCKEASSAVSRTLCCW